MDNSGPFGENGVGKSGGKFTASRGIRNIRRRRKDEPSFHVKDAGHSKFPGGIESLEVF